jgi:hypothetical protein
MDKWHLAKQGVLRRLLRSFVHRIELHFTNVLLLLLLLVVVVVVVVVCICVKNLLPTIGLGTDRD